MPIFDFSDYQTDEEKKKKTPSQLASEQIKKNEEKKKTEGAIFNFSDYKPKQAPEPVVTPPPVKQPSFWDKLQETPVVKAVKNEFSSFGDRFKKNVSSLTTKPPAVEFLKTEDITNVKLDNPNIPTELTNGLTLSINQTQSAQLTPEAKEVVMKKSAEVEQAFNDARSWLNKEIGNIKPFGSYASAVPDIERVGSTQTLDEIGGGYSQESVDQQVEAFNKTAFAKANHKGNIFLGDMTTGFTGGILKPEREASKDTADKVVGAIGETMGAVAALNKIGKVFEGFATGSTTIGQFIQKYPRASKYLIPFTKSAVSFDIYGQLDPDIENRFQKLLIDTAVAIPFSLIGNVKSPVYSVPASFGLGFGLAKLSGAPNDEAIISGSIFAVLDASGRLGKGGNINAKTSDRIMRNEALETLNRYAGTKLNEKSPIADIKAAYRQAAKTYHPDRGGTQQDAMALNAAYSFLSGKASTFTKSIIPDEKISGLLGDGTYAPEVAIERVIRNKAENTPEGKKILERAFEAQKTGSDLVVKKEPKKIPDVVQKELDKTVSKEEVITAEDQAKALIRSYVERGDTLKSLMDGQMGQAGGGFSTNIGGYMNGKKYGNDKILVTQMNGKEVLEVFSLKKIYDAIKAEKKVEPVKEPIKETKAVTLKTETVKPSKDFYTANISMNGNSEFRKTIGNEVKIIEGIDTFVHKTEGGKGYTVSEGKTGLKIADGRNRIEAVEKAKVLLTKNQDQVQGMIDQAVEKRGLSPRYSKQSIIKDNEKPTDQGVGGKPRPGQPTDTVPQGTSKQAGTGETAKVSGEGVARGERKVSDTGAGERPTARITAGQDIKDLDAQIRTIEKPTEDYPRWTVEIGLQESLGEQGGDILTETYDHEPTLDEVRQDILDEYKSTKEKINEEVVPGIVSKTGREDLVESAIDKVLTRNLDTKNKLRQLIEQGFPSKITQEIEADWTDNYSKIYDNERNPKLKDQLETAFVNKWQQKVTEYNKPATPSKTQQVDINKQIEDLVAKKGTEGYTSEEKALLRKYTGSGGLEQGGAEGRGLLDEYFTPEPIVNFMWDKVNEIERVKTRMLEPSAGIGGFFERVPKGVQKIGYEINPVSAKIAEILHGTDLNMNNEPFESLFVGSRGEEYPVTEIVDLVIGNPPYGEHRGKYLGLGEEPKIVKYEEYFMKRGLDILKENGLLAYIIPSTFIRSGSNYAKEEIGKLGRLETAYRLPQGVFGTTTIGTDIVIFRKGGKTDPLFISDDNYFLNNPKNVLGQISKGTGRYGQDEVVGTLEEAIRKANDKPVEIADSIPEEQVVEVEKEQKLEIDQSERNVNPNALVKGANQEIINAGNKLKKLAQESKNLIEFTENAIKLMVKDKGVDDFLTQVGYMYEEGAVAQGIVDENGNPERDITFAFAQFWDKNKNVAPVKRVPENPVVTNELNKKAIIIPNKKDGRLKLNDVSVEDNNMWVSVNVTGELNPGYTAGFKPEIFVNNKVAVEFENGVAKYYPNILYYQGNVYEKLDNLELFRNKISPKQYEIQKKGLEAILPTPQKIENIQLQPPSDFVRDIRVPATKELDGQYGKNESLVELFQSFIHSLPWEAFGGSSSWEVEGYLRGSVVNTGDKIQNIEVRKRRRATGNSLFKRFMQEVLTPEQQQYIEDRYNRSFNAYYRPDYKQVPILSEVNASFNPKHKPGKHTLEVKAIQKEGAAFLSTKGAGLLGYDVGVGKTLTAIVAINDVMAKGWAKKPLLVVPNGVYRNWINEISEVIPNVKINSLMNLGAAFKGDLKTLEIEDGTLSIITYDGLVKLGFKPETYDELTGDLKDVMLGMNNTKRAAAKEEANVEKEIGRAIRGTTGDRFFEDLGFDHITIDEVHNFKNIFAGAKLERGQGNEYRNVRGSSSARGIKAYLMAQYVLKNNNNRNVFLLSATPFTNSPLEIYSILSLMGKKRLEDLGLKNVNDFMSMFMELKPTFVVKADQTVKEEDVIEKFQNLQQLQKLVTEFIDFRTGEEAGVDRPGRIKKTVALNPTELQNEYVTKAQALFADKKNGGAIVAITELQNITLSPYLSRYNEHQPTYREFVDNSPKIKFAIEAIAQVYKDNHNVGQIIYMPRGIDKFPLIREYLVKEKKFKSSQIGEITGGMNIDVKQKIQDAFNSGEIKVLIGTEAIKEGVNLQERATDLYHLHLPWNPTDMLQVEGRIWRQGNDWANVRVHYPLIENSVDSFIFQKLETKEKRIRNLWSYKDNEISLGDLDFENMKLDLITDPVIRVKAEQTFETKKKSQKLEQLKVERSFTSRKIEKLDKAERDLESAIERLKDAEVEATKDIDSYEARNLSNYRDNVSRKKSEVTAQRNDLTQKGIDVTDLENKTKELDTQIKEQDKIIEELDTKFESKLKEAEGKKSQLVSKPNNYFVLTKEIANENATFFKKRAGQEAVRAANTAYTAPGGTASLGGYADVESATKTVEGIKSVEFPELLRLSRELMGDTPMLKRFRRALGRFYSIDQGVIKLHPDIFKDPKLASKVLAHELGHLADYLPDPTLVRGNILGRIASLNKFLKGSFGDKEINNADIRAELKDLSQAWKPFDELQNPNFTSYRYSSKELYADAISVLFSDPALLKEKAPKFWEAFFENLDSKPKVKEEFNQTWDLLNQGEEAVFQSRNEALNQAYAKAEEVWAAKTVEKQTQKTNIVHVVRTLFDDKNYKLNKRVADQIKSGAKIEDKLNPVFDFAGLNYLDGKMKNFVASNFQPAYIKAAEVDGGWETLGKILQMERTINERGDLANPGGFDPKTAQDFLTGLEKSVDPADWLKIQEAKELFRSGMQAVVKLAEENGYYKPEMLEQMKANPAYATYQVIDYLDTYVSASIKKQVGTLKDIANPATSSVMKAIATMKAIEYNNAKKSGIDFERDFNPEEIKPAKRMWTGKFWEIIDSKDPELGTVVIIRNGEPEGYYIDKELADVFNHTTSQSIMMGAKLSRMMTGSAIYRPLFTSLNLGFQSFNLVRDFMRYWKNVPDYTFKDAFLSLPRVAVRYGQAAPHVLREVTNKPDVLIQEMENSKMLGMTFNDMFHNPDETEAKQIERVMQKAGVLQSTRKRNLLSPVYSLFDKVELIGNFIERLPKVAGYIELKGKMPENELAEFVRNYIGSPNFRTSGTLTPITNNLLLFSNAYKEGIKSDFRIATTYKTSGGKRTRGGFWWKTMFSTFLPKALMLAATIGLMGEWMKKRMEDVSEYDKTNYNIVPMGVDENGKTIYLRVPQDETGRMIGGFFWKLSHLITKEKSSLADILQVIDFGAGQLPGLVPSITGMSATMTYLSGKNPYDSFRGRNVIPDNEFEAGMKYSLPIFLDWLIKNQGLSIILPSYTPEGDLTDLQKVISAPGLSNILGRWVKVSDQGQREKLREVERSIAQPKAVLLVENKKKIDKAVKDYNSGDKSMTRRGEIERQLIKDVLGDPPYDSAERAKRTNLIKKFRVSLMRGLDPNVDAIIYATSTDERVGLLKEIAKTKTDQEMTSFMSDLQKQQILSNEAINAYKKAKNKKESAVPKKSLLSSISSKLIPQAYAAEELVGREEKFSDYQTGEASYYNATNPAETRPGTDGTGAYGRKVEPGSVAFGNRVFHDKLKKGEMYYVKVKGMENVKTPYGNGVFRIDDTMNQRYNQVGKYNIDFNPQDLTEEQKNTGRFNIEFKILTAPETDKPKPTKKKILKKYYA